jgi:hypothetical protein
VDDQEDLEDESRIECAVGILGPNRRQGKAVLIEMFILAFCFLKLTNIDI